MCHPTDHKGEKNEKTARSPHTSNNDVESHFNVNEESTPLTGKKKFKVGAEHVSPTLYASLVTALAIFLIYSCFRASRAAPSNRRHSSSFDRGSEFTGTQFISFTISTLGGLADRGECEGREYDHSSQGCYLGNSSNITEDVEHRLSLLLEVLEGVKNDTHAEEPQINHRRDILKIFMIPEFYMRGPEGAYDIRELMEDGILLETAEKLHDFVSVPEFSDYLFVFGTVIAKSTAHANNRAPFNAWDVPRLEDDELLLYNFAPIFRGGPSASHHKYIATKKIISTIDFLNNNTGLPNPHNEGIKQYDKIPDNFKYLLESRDVKLINDGVIDVDGIRIGMELCVDHMAGRLWEQLQKKNDPLVDVLLIISSGMAIQYGPNPIVPGGVTYMTDGGSTSAACWRSDEDTNPYDPERVCRLPGPKGIKHFPPLPDDNYSSFFTVSACKDVLSHDKVRGYYSTWQLQGCSYSLQDFGINVLDENRESFPSIEYYPTVDLPKHHKINH